MAGSGGAWKVAYADFVTAMMALFMVLWISAQDQKILIATSRYFQNPFNSVTQSSSGILNLDSAKPTQTESSSKDNADDAGAGGAPPTSSPREVDLKFLNSVAKDVYRLLNLDESFADRPIDIQVTSDGLRLTLYDRAKKPLFVDNSAEFTAWGSFIMQSLAWMIDRHLFYVVIEGHTRRGLNLPGVDYTAWELSSDRSNAARRALVHYAVSPDLIERVTGYADTRPIDGLSPDHESNHRVTLSLSLGRRVKTPDDTAQPLPPLRDDAP